MTVMIPLPFCSVFGFVNEPLRTGYPRGMRQSHDQTSVPHAESSRTLWGQACLRSLAAAELPSIEPGSGVDPLSHVLQTVRLTGALYFPVDASSPWGVEVPPPNVFSPVILPRAQHVISYHIVLTGSGWPAYPG
jgi:hypothetical protein